MVNYCCTNCTAATEAETKGSPANSPEYTVFWLLLLLLFKGPERNKIPARQNAVRHHCVVSLGSVHLRESKKREVMWR